MTDQEIETLLHQFFDDNLETLKLEGNHVLTVAVRESARQQVLMYWRKLNGIAKQVTDTEVKLTLPAQQSPEGRPFAIEGVVDIVQNTEQTTMYDLKTHDEVSIRSNIESYEAQLNVYAYIWQHLRGEKLDRTAIISTDLPEAVQRALREQREGQLDFALAKWQPIIEIPCKPDQIEQTLHKFGEIVDQIEGGNFAPPSADQLQNFVPGTRSAFGRYVCRNCDARFSCSSYRQYIRHSSRGKFEAEFRQYVLQDYGDDEARLNRRLLEGEN